jgi:hypothetical protein
LAGSFFPFGCWAAALSGSAATNRMAKTRMNEITVKWLRLSECDDELAKMIPRLIRAISAIRGSFPPSFAEAYFDVF